jgi:hypothetical protein
MSRKPSLKFPAGCNGPAEVKAAYRFLDNEHITFMSILGPHRNATVERIREQTVVLIPQDTTELDLTRPREIMDGAGPLNDSSRVGFHDHVSLAMTPERLILGVVDAKVWAGPRRVREGRRPEARERRAKPIEDKESVRWLEGYRGCVPGCSGGRGRTSSRSPIVKEISMSISSKANQSRSSQGVVHHSSLSEPRLAPDDDTSPESHNLLGSSRQHTGPGATDLEIRGRDPKSKDDRKRKQAREPARP